MKKILTAAMMAAMTAYAGYADTQALTPEEAATLNAIVSGVEGVTTTNDLYVEDALVIDGYKGHWFIGAQVGASAFLGTPIGCDDLFGRMKPLVKIEAGKWFTPSVATRVVYEGWQLKDAMGASQNYQNWHLDLMWDILARPLRQIQEKRWGIVPYIGVGLVNSDAYNKAPFAISYGIQGTYAVNDKLSVKAELGSTTTTAHLDGYTGEKKWGDGFLNFSIGVSYTLGQSKWKKVLDARPYIDQYDHVMACNRALQECNDALIKSSKTEITTGMPRNNYSGINSLRARLEANRNAYGANGVDGTSAYGDAMKGNKNGFGEDWQNGENGLFGDEDAYGNAWGGTITAEDIENLLRDEGIDLDGSGIDANALAAAMNNGLDADGAGIFGEYNANADGTQLASGGDKNGDNSAGFGNGGQNGANGLGDGDDFGSNGYGNGNAMTDAQRKEAQKDYLNALANRKKSVGPPIYFFFNIGTVRLTDDSQLINLEAIAKVAIKHGLNIRVIGSADSATGNAEINTALSRDRAEYVRKELIKKGISKDRITTSHVGGTAKFAADKANRNTYVELYF